jgi:Anti-sigma-K factor rskA
VRLLHHDLHILTGAYAVDAIHDDTERDRFERHLRRCRPCASEVRGLAGAAARLALAASRPPPPQMRGPVLAAVARTRQLPPAADRHSPRRARRPRTPRLAWAVAVASLAVILVLAVTVFRVQHQLDQARSRDRAIAAVLGAPEARAVTQATSAGGTATVVFSGALHSMIFTSAGLAPLPSGRVYELWLLGPPRVRPAGLLAVGPAGRSVPVLAGGLVRGDQVGLTVEPAGGTRQPTTTPVLVMPLPS